MKNLLLKGVGYVCCIIVIVLVYLSIKTMNRIEEYSKECREYDQKIEEMFNDDEYINAIIEDAYDQIMSDDGNVYSFEDHLENLERHGIPLIQIGE